MASGKPGIICRFIGATANSTDPRSLLEGLCKEIYAGCGLEEVKRMALEEISGEDEEAGKKRDEVESRYATPSDLQRLGSTLRRFVESIPVNHPTVLLLDALDQLQVSDRPDLSWLPDKLPAHVRLVVSAIPGPMLEALKSRLPSARFLELGPMHAGDAAGLLQKWLQRAGRRLAREEQRQAIRDGFTRCSLPLYLRLAFEEAQRWHSYNQPPPPSPDVGGLIERLFNRLSEPANHGQLLVERAVSYLRCSRHGLSEDETLDLLANDPEYWEHFRQSAHHPLPVTEGQQTRRLPVVLWSRLYHDLEPYLSWRSAHGTALMVFFHTRFNEVADRHFLRDDTVRRARHDSLATYFHTQDYFLESVGEQRARAKRLPPTPRRANVRKVKELPWQRLREAQLSGHWDKVEELFTDFFFLEAKAEAGLVFDLTADFELAVAALPPEHPHHWILCLLEEALRRDIHFIARHPTTLFQCMWNRCYWYDSPSAAAYLQPPEPDSNDSDALSDNDSPHECIVLWQLAEENRRRLCSSYWEEDGTNLGGPMVFQSLLPPRERLGSLLALTLAGHSGIVTAVRFSPDDMSVATSSSDKTIRVWDSVTGAELAVLRGHTDDVTCLAWSRDGSMLPSGSFDGSLCVWVPAEGRLFVQVHLGSEITAVAFSDTSAELFVGGHDMRIHLVDLRTGRIRSENMGHAGTMRAATIRRLRERLLLCPCWQHPLQFNPFFAAAWERIKDES